MQSVGKIPVDVRALGVDLLSLSAHKFNGPKGAGALWIKRGTRVTRDHDRRQARAQPARRDRERPGDRRARRRGAAGPRRSCERRPARLAALRDRLEEAMLARVPGTAINGAREPRVPNTTNISFDGVEAESLLIALDLEGVAVSTGFGVLLGHAGAVARAARDGPAVAPRRRTRSESASAPATPTRSVDYVLLREAAGASSTKLRSLTRASNRVHGLCTVPCESSSRCPAASIRRSPRRCSPRGARGHRPVDAALRPARAARSRFGTCCTIDDLHDARRVAARIGIPHYIVNFEREFDDARSIANFVRRVRRGPDADSVRRTATAT